MSAGTRPVSHGGMTTTSLLPRERAGMCWWEFSEHGDAARVMAAVSTRHGGVSEGGFESLNLSLSVGDELDRVGENRRRFFDSIGIEPKRVSYLRQVHVMPGKGLLFASPTKRYGRAFRRGDNAAVGVNRRSRW